MSKIIVADTCAVVRGAMELLVHDVDPCARVYGTDNFIDTLSLVRQHEIDMLVIDLALPGSASVGPVHQLHIMQPSMRILVSCPLFPAVPASLLLKQGVYGCIDAATTIEEWRRALRTMLDGNLFHSAAFLQQPATDVARAIRMGNPLHRLSRREKAVLNYILDGRTYIEICAHLGLKPSTISTYRVRIFSKLNVANLVQLHAVHSLLKTDAEPYSEFIH